MTSNVFAHEHFALVMDRQQLIAILFVLLMVGSSIAYGVASLI
ncbi:MAG: hypothetical protein ABEH64_05305 [Salinirussus sp.]